MIPAGIRSRAWRPAISGGLVLILALLPGPPAPEGAPSPPASGFDDPTPQWRQGPCRYLLTRKESEAFARLGGEESRRNFIERFWAGLDPTPGTSENERRETFWSRVGEAGRRFQRTTRPGWETDRGMIYILLGPPDEREEAPGRETWRYREVEGDAGPRDLLFVFLAGKDGELSLAARTLDSSLRASRDISRTADSGPAPDPLARARTKPPVGTTLSGCPQNVGRPATSTREAAASVPAPVPAVRGARSGGAGPPVAGSLLEAQRVPGRVRLAPDSAWSWADHFFAPLPISSRHYFTRGERKETLVRLVVAAPSEPVSAASGSEPPRKLVLGLTVRRAGNGEVILRVRRNLVAGDLDAPSTDLPPRFETDFTLPPGTFRAVGTLIDEDSHRGAALDLELSVPDFTSGLALSDLRLSREPPPAPPGSPPVDCPVPIPDPDAVLNPGDSLRVAAEIFNARRKHGRPDLGMEVRCFLEQGGRLIPAGPVESLDAAGTETLDYTLRNRGWKEGDYRIRLTVTDRLGGNVATREASFRVRALAPVGRSDPPGSSPPASIPPIP